MTEENRTREELLDDLREYRLEIEDLNSEIANLRSENNEYCETIQHLEGEIEGRKDPGDAIEAFIYELDRPCGSHKFTIPDTPRVHDAIRAMADAIGRNV